MRIVRLRPALLFAAVLLCGALAALAPNSADLPHELSPNEQRLPLGRDFAPTDPPAAPVRPVAEWEPMRGALVRWSGNLGIPWSLAVAIAQRDELVTIVADASLLSSAQSAYAANGVNLANCRWLLAPTNSKWTRDYGPFFIMGDSLAVADFIYNRPRQNDDAIPSAYAAWDTLACYGMSVVHTGGNWMTDGVSTAASTELVWTENSGMTHAEIGAEIAAYTGATTYHVLPDPLGDYIEHIDCWGKFLAPDKVLIGRVAPSDSRYASYEYVANYFAAAVSAWGTPYEVWRVDTPGDWPHTPYTNSLILNDRVFVPQTGHDLDDDALAVYRAAMPGYEIVGVDYTGWLNTDALHCRVHELPDKRMLELRCTPRPDAQPAQDSLLVDVFVRAHSGAPLLADSLRLYWRISPDTLWSHFTLQHAVGDTFTVTTPPLDDEVTVEYWFRAVDATGRSAQHPVMGPHDPFSFTTVFTALDAPQLRIAVENNVATLHWDEVTGATLYRVWSADDADSEVWTLEAETEDTIVSLPADDEKRYYRVTAVR